MPGFPNKRVCHKCGGAAWMTDHRNIARGSEANIDEKAKKYTVAYKCETCGASFKVSKPIRELIVEPKSLEEVEARLSISATTDVRKSTDTKDGAVSPSAIKGQEVTSTDENFLESVAKLQQENRQKTDVYNGQMAEKSEDKETLDVSSNQSVMPNFGEAKPGSRAGNLAAIKDLRANINFCMVYTENFMRILGDSGEKRYENVEIHRILSRINGELQTMRVELLNIISRLESSLLQV